MAKTNRSGSVRLNNERKEELCGELHDVITNLRAIHDLAISFHGGGIGAETVMTAAENLSKISIRKTDLVAVALGAVRAGNFEEEFSALGVPK